MSESVILPWKGGETLIEYAQRAHRVMQAATESVQLTFEGQGHVFHLGDTVAEFLARVSTEREAAARQARAEEVADTLIEIYSDKADVVDANYPELGREAVIEFLKGVLLT